MIPCDECSLCIGKSQDFKGEFHGYICSVSDKIKKPNDLRYGCTKFDKKK